ncbi:serine hydrolase domain-containing protein [Deinococcus multiflagellatus]|uniref:Serine hydrolase domain-containing protein n=1 Tax=Deinococcus multiflagellatus TaxID=1656887 RepID=A0ABW1ZIB0_9DEIO|nr:serine hydrolase domain-containing protein [Deinococcus multiflagellatus]MBZ9713672.1 beta-lactamase family protein [Deinococcus multiflagellatus]
MRPLFLLAATALCGAAQASPPALSPQSLARAAAYSATHRGDALLAVQGAREVWAQGQNGFALNAPHVLASGSKTFGCALAVALQDAGVLRLDERVADTLTEWSTDARRGITVRQLLNFTSGLPGNVGRPVPTLNLDLSAEARRAPLQAAPGTQFSYGNAHLAVFAELVRRKTGHEPEAELQRRVLDALDIHPVWARDRAGQADLAGGARLDARSWARFGELLLRGGRWQGRAVLSAAGLQACQQGSAALNIYGLTLWLNLPAAGTLDAGDTVPVAALGLKGERLMPSQPTNVVMAAGLGNQRLYLLPDHDAVVVRFGRGGEWSDDAFLQLLTAQP